MAIFSYLTIDSCVWNYLVHPFLNFNKCYVISFCRNISFLLLHCFLNSSLLDHEFLIYIPYIYIPGIYSYTFPPFLLMSIAMTPLENLLKFWYSSSEILNILLLVPVFGPFNLPYCVSSSNTKR